MGMYPYDCVLCGGAYSRCGNEEHPRRCKGGQFCWEDAVYCQVVEIVISGENEDEKRQYEAVKDRLKVGSIIQATYDGGGEYENWDFDDIEFVDVHTEGSEPWQDCYVAVRPACASCYIGATGEKLAAIGFIEPGPDTDTEN